MSSAVTPSDYLPTSKDTKKIMISPRYLADQSDWTTGFAVITCELEMQGGSLLFILFFILCYVQ